MNNSLGMPYSGGGGGVLAQLAAAGGFCSLVLGPNVVDLSGGRWGGRVGREKDPQAPSTLNPGCCSLPFSFLASTLWVEEPECIWRPRWSLSGFCQWTATESVLILQMGKLREAQAKPLPACGPSAQRVSSERLASGAAGAQGPRHCGFMADFPGKPSSWARMQWC